MHDNVVRSLRAAEAILKHLDDVHQVRVYLPALLCDLLFGSSRRRRPPPPPAMAICFCFFFLPEEESRVESRLQSSPGGLPVDRFDGAQIFLPVSFPFGPL